MRYIALVWDNRVQEIRAIASRLMRDAFRFAPSETIAILPGLCVWRPGNSSDSFEQRILTQERGVIVGTIFEREDGGGQTRSIGDEEFTIVGTAGQHLIDRYWGSYVAFLRDPKNEEVHILRDPSGGIHCYHSIHCSLHIYFSDIRDVVALRLMDFTVNWRYIAVNLVAPALNGTETGLNEVREVCPGECDTIVGGRVNTRTSWDPSQIAMRDALEESTNAANELKRICKYCISKWTTRDQSILVLLSGGVDSSILLGCARSTPNPPKITTFTQFVSGPDGADERPYARQAVQAAGCHSLESSMDVEFSMDFLLELPHTARPRMYLSTVNDPAIIQAARQTGANAIYNGNGGDQLFYKHPEHAATDYLCREGIGFRFLKIVYATAYNGRKSFWSVLRGAFENRGRFKPLDVIRDGLKNHAILSPKAIAIAHDTPLDFLSPWLCNLRDLPIGKRVHILGLSLPTIAERPFCQMGNIVERAVLFSQPILEYLLSIPTDILTEGGLTRSLARSAFVHEVPRAILARNDKGSTQAVATHVLKRNQHFARALLLDGLLVNEGLLDKEKVSRGLSDQPSVVSSSEMLCHLSTEIWLRRWQSSAPV